MIFWIKLILRAPIAVVVVITLPIIWVIQFILFLPLLLTVRVLSQPRRKKDEESKPTYAQFRIDYPVYNRVQDVSKLYGCNTRNVEYRWDIFVRAIQSLKSRSASNQTLEALDFGAGSLRDTYELARMGFKVDAIDMNEESLRTYQQCYDWESVPIRPNIRNISVFDLEREKRFDIITAFDVLEHLCDLDEHLDELRNRLNADGIILITVPNRRALFEKDAYHQYRRKIREKRLLDPSAGMPHVQFKTPEEWAAFFRSKGFTVLSHEMGIGFLVNDCWFAFYHILVRTFVDPFIDKVSRPVGFHYTWGSFAKLFYPAWQVEQVNVIDEAFKPLLKHRWGWNLFVLTNGPDGRGKR